MAVTILGPLAYVAPLNWQLIASIPDDRMDGRDVLLWKGAPIVSTWCDGWCDAVGRPVHGVTHWADIEGPEAATCPAR